MKTPHAEIRKNQDGKFEVCLVYPIERMASEMHKLLTVGEQFDADKRIIVTIPIEDEKRTEHLTHILDIEGYDA